MKVLVIGMRGLGAEVAQNLIMCGTSQVDLYDNELCTVRDMGSNFCITKEHCDNKVSRAEACKSMAELNSRVSVNVITELNTKNYHCVVVTEN
jgi:ubiquitin-activating enzyme E1